VTVRGIASIALTLCLLSGCGTVANIAELGDPAPDHPVIYGGVRKDIAARGNALTGAMMARPLDGGAQSAIFEAVALQFTLDIPFSVVGDTLTLPVTIPAELLRSPKESAADRASDQHNSTAE
jgi:uncharacterized protein YceK